MPCVMVTAWGAATRMSLASTVATDGNETEAALRLVELLQLNGERLGRDGDRERL